MLMSDINPNSASQEQPSAPQNPSPIQQPVSYDGTQPTPGHPAAPAPRQQTPQQPQNQTPYGQQQPVQSPPNPYAQFHNPGETQPPRPYAPHPAQPSQPSGQYPPMQGTPGGGYGYIPPQRPGYPGQAYPPQGSYYPPAYQTWNVMCIVGFVFSFIIPPVGLVLSIVALVQINKSGEKSKPLSIAGIVVGAVSTALIALFIGFVVWAAAEAISNPQIWDDSNYSCTGTGCDGLNSDNGDNSDNSDNGDNTDSYSSYTQLRMDTANANGWSQTIPSIMQAA